MFSKAVNHELTPILLEQLKTRHNSFLAKYDALLDMSEQKLMEMPKLVKEINKYRESLEKRVDALSGAKTDAETRRAQNSARKTLIKTQLALPTYHAIKVQPQDETKAPHELLDKKKKKTRKLSSPPALETSHTRSLTYVPSQTRTRLSLALSVPTLIQLAPM
jgi:GTPase involved in cell partitioning and DNA repair